MTARMAVVKNICPCADRYLCAEYPLTGDTLRSVSDDLGFAPIWSVEHEPSTTGPLTSLGLEKPSYNGGPYFTRMLICKKNGCA